MVVDTLNPANDTATSGNKNKGKTKQILADPQSLAPYRDATDKMGQKNVQLSVPGHPKLYAHILESLAKDPHNLEGEDGKVAVKRTAYTNAIRVAVATYFSFPYGNVSELVILKRGTAGLMSLFQSQVQNMFETVRAVAAMGGMTNEDQIKALAFERAKGSITSHPQLANIEITDELLEALWSGADIEIDDDEEDEEDTETSQDATPATPAQSFS